MPKRTKKPCKKMGCNKLVEYPNTYCEEHRYIKERKDKESNKLYDKEIRHKKDKKYRDFYHSKEWERVRKLALERDKGLCQECKKNNIITFADMVHHIEEVKDNWDRRLELDNLVSLCFKCHNKVHRR